MKSIFLFFIFMNFVCCKSRDSTSSDPKTIDAIQNAQNYDVITDILRSLLIEGLKRNDISPEKYGVSKEYFTTKNYSENLYTRKNPLSLSLEFLGNLSLAFSSLREVQLSKR